MQQQYGEISKQDRKAWNRYVRERSIRRSEGAKQAGVAAGGLFMLAFTLITIDLPTGAGVAFLGSIFFALVSYIMNKLYGQKEQGH